MDEYSRWKVAEELLGGSGYSARAGLASEAAQAGKELELPEHDFRHRVCQLREAYTAFLDATNNFKVEPEKQLHWYNRFRAVRLTKKLGEPEITQELLSNAAHRYLKGSLRVPLLDRGLLDAFIAQETFAYIDRAAGRGAFFTQFGCLGVMVVGSSLWTALYGDPAFDWARYGKVLGAMLLVFLVVWAWPKKGPYALYREMRDTYQLLTGSVVSVPELRRRVERARDRGVVWPADLYAVLDDVESRTKVLT